jgi:NAD(P)-dependent dehydrogenase (short-subunit alcohol dehydrogenase family)
MSSEQPGSRVIGVSSPFDLNGSVALITGATHGIGRGIVEEMARHGAKVALSSRKQVECDRVAADINETVGQDMAIGFASDLRDADSLDALVGSTLRRWGRIDCLVANAAILQDDCETDDPLGPAVWQAMLMANVQANFHLARQVAHRMIAQGGGSIIFVSSLSAAVAVPSRLAYGAGKAALENMARTLAAALAGHGVRVNCIAPGGIRTRGSQALYEDATKLAAYARQIPLRRTGEPSEVGAAAVFLAAKASAYVTGATIPVDGGRTTVGLVVGANELADQL